MLAVSCSCGVSDKRWNFPSVLLSSSFSFCKTLMRSWFASTWRCMSAHTSPVPKQHHTSTRLIGSTHSHVLYTFRHNKVVANTSMLKVSGEQIFTGGCKQQQQRISAMRICLGMRPTAIFSNHAKSSQL